MATINPLLELTPGASEQPGVWQQLKSSAIMGIKEALGVDENDANLARKQPEIKNQRIYDEFVQQVQRQQDLLLDATKEQTDIFKKLEVTLLQLKNANREDSLRLRKSLDALVQQLDATPDTAAKQKIANLIPLQQSGITASTRENRPATAQITPRTQAVPALLMAPPAASNTPLYEDAGLISSESEGDLVQTGERETDMASILGFLGNMMSGNDGTGVLPIIPRTTPRKTPPALPKTKPTTRPTPPRGPDGKFRKPTVVDRIKGPGTRAVLQKVPFLGPLVTGGFMGADEYEKSGNLGKALVVGTGSAVTGELGAFLGTGVGSMLGPVGAVGGSIAGGIAGASVGASSASKLYDTFTGTQPDTVKPDNQILEQSMQNKDLTQQAQTQPAAPVIINNQQTVGNNAPPAYIAPSLEVRPKESALDRYINRQTVY
jgi:outer membrane lipoprotein SlyB